MTSALAAMTLHLSPAGRGRIASADAIRVRGLAPSRNARPLTRRFVIAEPSLRRFLERPPKAAYASPHRGEVFEQTIQSRL